MNPYTSGDAIQLHGHGDVTYMPPLIYWAAAKGDIQIIHTAMRRADQYLTPKKNNVIHIAAEFGKLKCIKWMIRYYNVDSCLLLLPNLKGDSPLHLAAREGHLKVVKALIRAARQLPPETDIESGIEVDYKAMLIRMTNNDNDTALHEAVRYYHPELVKLLIREDPGFTYGANFSGLTPLYMAAERGFTDLVQIIIQNTTTQPAHTGPIGRTALHAAVTFRNPEMVEAILEWNPDLTKQVDENGWSPLHCAAYLGSVSIMRQLLADCESSVVYLKVNNNDNKTALLLAATRGNVKTIRLLVSRHPDCCEQVDVNGNNVLHLLMMQTRVFKSLLKIPWMNVGSLLNEKNVDGQTPLHLLADFQLRIRPAYIRNKKVDKMALNNENLNALDKILLAEDFFGGKDYIIRRLRRNKGRVGPLLWQKTAKKKNKDDKREDVEVDEEMIKIKKSKEMMNKGLDTSFFRKASDIHMLVAALVATVSFAAGFTLPGGYDDKDGMAILRNKTSFRAFVVADSAALLLSVAAVLCHFYSAVSNHKKQVIFFLKSAYWCTKLGVGAMVLAFLTNLYTVLPHHSGITIFTLIICVCASILSITSGTPAGQRYF